MQDVPKLVDPKVKGFLKGALSYSHSIKKEYVNVAYNIFFAVIFIFIIGSFLIYKYRGKLTPVEKEVKKRKEYDHVLLQIKKMETEKFKEGGSVITHLPIL